MKLLQTKYNTQKIIIINKIKTMTNKEIKLLKNKLFLTSLSELPAKLYYKLKTIKQR